MKKCIVLIFALLLLSSLVGCGKQTVEKDNLYRAYVCHSSDDLLQPSILLWDDNRFQFTFSTLSSYLGIGTYVIEGENLILRTDDGKYTYTFKIEGKNIDRLIFVAERSSGTLHMGAFGDGAVFE